MIKIMEVKEIDPKNEYQVILDPSVNIAPITVILVYENGGRSMIFPEGIFLQESLVREVRGKITEKIHSGDSGRGFG